MAIFNINTNYTGQVGISPREVKIFCNDSYATITTLNWLQGAIQQGYNFYPNDVFLISYQDNAYGFFKAIFGDTGITLEPNVAQGDVTLPVVPGNLAEFANIDGTISDSGIAAEDVPTFASLPVTNGAFPKFNGTAGVLGDSGILVADLQVKTNINAQVLTWAGGSASHAFTITGLTTSSVVVPVQASAANAETILSYAITANTLTITWTGDPGAVVVHAVSFFAPQ